MFGFDHEYAFDPNYGYSLADLLAVPAPKAPDDFSEFWQQRYQRSLTLSPAYQLKPCGTQAGFQVYELSYQSTAEVIIRGWLLTPEQQTIKRAVIVGHGYGGREQPDYHLKPANTALLFPCFRGLGKSRSPKLPESPDQHVLWKIDDPQQYIMGGCVDDLWLAVSVLQQIYPQTIGHIGYMGISFGGGIGALGVPWDARIKRAHFNVPTFGNQPLRTQLPTTGSAAAVQDYFQQHHNVLATLSYYDAALAAEYGRQDAHFALALFDPVVAPPGQFAIYNTWAGQKSLFILEAGHFAYPNQIYQELQLLNELNQFFGEI
ncbi:acetylxylan esterase [Methylomonas paludis]|uniref:Acetylxylan esterase n=1 Tax=Methylomonas paludis TaxID=1173101 RepID=A0A975MKH0_9GAMM|nr:acetylxylan esterase [Methylomonas paludis]QWF69457.1 acetylxylan esterase [Methylomonas paludis]